MNISKISRSLVVVIFVAFVLYLSFLNISLLMNKTSVESNVQNNLIKIGYTLYIICLVSLYVYIKDKLYKMRVKRSISLVYRYIYITLTLIGTSLFSYRDTLNNTSIKYIFVYVLMLILTSISVKRIIFNVSKSDILSVLGMFMCSSLPVITSEIYIKFNSVIISLSFFVTVLILQILIDELKQKGMKTNKYIVESVILGIMIGVSIILGINYILFIVMTISMIFITINLDNTHITFPNKIITSVTKEKREMLYKIERININKLIVSIIVSIAISFCIYKVSENLINKIDINKVDSKVFFNLLENYSKNKVTDVSIGLQNFNNYSKSFLDLSKTYYMVVFTYILCLELLAFVLKRRYDTKSTVMKIIFISIFIILNIFNLNIYYYQPMITVLLVIIAIVNTSNIYLNREERIKMLVA